MDLSSYVDHLRRELAVAAEAGGEEARALAERLITPLDSATRLVLLEALSDAADEITRDLAPGSVELRLRGREPGFVVNSPFTAGHFAAPGAPHHPYPPAPPMPPMPPGAPMPPMPPGGPFAMAAPPYPPAPPAPPAPPEPEEGGTARISLRVPEHLKPRIEDAARNDGISVNAWLVRAVSSALDGKAAPGTQESAVHQENPYGGQRITGWVR